MGIQIVNSPNKTLLYKSPHVFHTVTDETVTAGVATSVNTGCLFTPVYTDKGPTDVVKYFYGSDAYDEMIRTFGYPNTRKLGLAYTAAVEHVANGGSAVLISVKHDSATCSGFIINLVLETRNNDGSSMKKTLGWIKPDGSAFIEDSKADLANRPSNVSQDHGVHQIESPKIYFEVEEISGIKNVDTLKLLVNTKFNVAKTSSGFKRSFPLIYGLYKGKGKYGNNFKMIFTPTNKTEKGASYFSTNIYDKKTQSFVYGTNQEVSLSTVRMDGEPLFIERKFMTPYSTGEYYMGTLENAQMNHIGEEIEKALKGVVLFPNSATQAGVLAEAFEANFKEYIKIFGIPVNDDFHRMSAFDPTAVDTINKYIIAEPMLEANFSGGSEGILDKLVETGWDWNRQYNVAESNQPQKMEKVLATMFSEAFQGIRNSDVYNLLTNPCDYIIDFGYPMEVKKSMVTFSTNRDEVQIIFNSPLDKEDISQNIAWKQGFNIKGRNIYYYPGSFDFIDNRLDKSFRVPQSFSVMFNLLTHYKDKGFSLPVAGIGDGTLSMVEAGSGKGFGNMLLKDNDRLYDAGFNVVSSHMEGLLYLDSQRANYLLTETSKLQELHNNSIINRILKAMYINLQYEKHKLTSPSSIASIVFKINTILKSEFEGKVKDIVYNGAFESSYAESIGLFTSNINIQFFGSIKYHHVNLRAVPIG